MQEAAMDRGKDLQDQMPDVDGLAREVLQQCRISLMMAFRYLDVALWHLPEKQGMPEYPLSSSGTTLYYNPLLVLSRYREGPAEMTRDLLHCLMHCVFRQPFDDSHPRNEIWGLAGDILVESLAMDVAGERLQSKGDASRRRTVAGMEAAAQGKHLDVYEIYDQLREMSEQEVYSLSLEFARDDHHSWVMFKEATPPPEESDESQDSSDDDSQGDDANPDDIPPEGGESPNTAQQEWEDIAKEIETELESFGQDSKEVLTLLIELGIANRPKVDYHDFLRRFSTPSEEMKINDDEFDYIFYTYGLRTYGNMPLVEPLEYQETNRVRDFVVVIDTSGSTQGEPVRKFIQRTCEILREQQEFGSKINVHIIQCDTEVRADDKITCTRDLEDYMRTFEMKGAGGTDFRPAFTYVQKMVDLGEFENLQGLVYFTDGMGTYPERPTSFRTAFVFMDDGVFVKVPPWAMKVVMNEREVLEL